MKAARFQYVRPKDLPEALMALRAAGGEAKPLCGGQSLGPMLNLRLARPKLVVDVSRLEVMRRIEDKGAAWRIGAAVTHAELEDRPLPGCPMLAEVAATIAYRSVRNRGTIGGSIAHADPAGDWPLALAALDARVLIEGVSGARAVPAAAFVHAAFTTALRDDELVVAVEVPKVSVSSRWGYWKFCRKTGEFPEASAAFLLDEDRRLARLWVGALNGPPRSLDAIAMQVARKGAAAASEDAVHAVLASADVSGVQRTLHVEAVRRAIQKGLS